MDAFDIIVCINMYFLVCVSYFFFSWVLVGSQKPCSHIIRYQSSPPVSFFFIQKKIWRIHSWSNNQKRLKGGFRSFTFSRHVVWVRIRVNLCYNLSVLGSLEWTFKSNYSANGFSSEKLKLETTKESFCGFFSPRQFCGREMCFNLPESLSWGYEHHWFGCEMLRTHKLKVRLFPRWINHLSCTNMLFAWDGFASIACEMWYLCGISFTWTKAID